MNTDETFGRTIQLFLVDGRPGGLRKATIHGWTGTVMVGGESTFGQLTARDEVDRSGVYVLSGPDPDRIGQVRAYIGSANSVRERIKQSAEKRGFWETAITITTSDDDLSKGHAEYLEARLIELATMANRVSLDNGTKPEIAKRRLPEADRANMEQFIANLKIILPVVGLDMLKPQPRALQNPTASSNQDFSTETRFEITHKSGVQAEAVEEEGEFIVSENSEALTETGYVQHLSYGPMKERLIKEGTLVAKSKNRLRFTKPVSFSSPTAAAAIVLDRNSNGRTEWKVRGSGQTYHDWQQSRAAIEDTSE